MRILVILHSFEPGGVERVGLRLASAWADSGHEVFVIIGRDEGPQGVFAPDNVTYDFAPRSRLARHFETFWLIWHVMGAIRRYRPHILFCPGSTYTVVGAFVRLFLRSKCPPVIAKLSNSLERRDLSWVGRTAYKMWLRYHPNFVHSVVGMAPPMRDEIRRCLNIASDRIAIIPDPALDLEDLRALSLSKHSKASHRRYVAAGRLTRQKNFALLLRAFAAIAGPDDQLLILGDGPQRKMLERLAARLEIGERVEMPGHLQSVAEALASADVFVASSNYEGLPAVVVQALASGLPIVATDCSVSMEYLLGYGSLGQLVPIRDVQALSEAMKSAPERDEANAAAMRAVAAQFTIESSAKLYIDVFASTMARSAAASDSPLEAALARTR